MEEVAKALAIHQNKEGPFPSGELFEQYLSELVDILLDAAKVEECEFIMYLEEGPNSGKSTLSHKRNETFAKAYDAAKAAEHVIWDEAAQKKKKPTYAAAVGMSSCLLDILKPRTVCAGKEAFATEVFFFRSANEVG